MLRDGSKDGAEDELRMALKMAQRAVLLRCLTLHLPPPLPPSTDPPRMVSLSKTNVTARSGKPVELRCRFEANPAPLSGIVWRRLNPATKEILSEASCGGPLDNTRLARRMRVRCKRAVKKHRVSTVMMLAPTEGGDSGLYQCAMRNGAGRAATRNFEVLVPSE